MKIKVPLQSFQPSQRFHSLTPWLAGLTIGLSGLAVAQTTPPAAVGMVGASVAQAGLLTLDSALLSAVTTYPSITAQRGQKRVAEAEFETAKWGRFPTLTAEATRSEFGNSQTVARVQQPLWTGGRLTGQIRNTEAGVQAADASIAETEQSVMLETVTAYFEMLRAAARLKAAEENVAEHERLFRLISRRARNEVSPESDVTLATARLQTAISERIQFENLFLLSRATLEQLTGQRWQGVETTLRELPNFADVNEAVSKALAFSPELSRLKAQADQADAQIGVASSVLWPTVGIAHERRIGDISASQIRNQTYVTLQFQPGAGLSARSTIAAAAERKQALLDNTEAARRKLARQVEADWTEAQALSRQLAPSRQLVSSTRGVVESYTRQYTAGRKNWQDVLNAQREVAQALYTLADVEAARMRSILRVEIYTGRLTAQSLSAS